MVVHYFDTHSQYARLKPLLLICLLLLVLPGVVGASGPPQPKDYPDGVSSINPGSDLWREVRQRGLPAQGVTQVQGVESGVLINANGDRCSGVQLTD